MHPTNSAEPLHLLVGQASHFARWELPFWERHFTLVDAPHPGAVLVAFGPDVLFEAARLPASRRYAVLFPGFGSNPLHDLALRARQLAVLNDHFAGVFVNPGPLEIAFSSLAHLHRYPFSVDSGAIPHRTRTRIASLLHASADFPQKDYPRQLATLKATGLPYEVFPPRPLPLITRPGSPLHRPEKALRFYAARAWAKTKRGRATAAHPAYRSSAELHKRYLEHDAFVHIAGDIADPVYLDGKYTATVMEAALSGSIVFWHDTFGLGNDYETVIELPLEPQGAAKVIVEVAQSIDVALHSRLTREEFLERNDPAGSVAVRASVISGRD
jgi:hypothetical protein